MDKSYVSLEQKVCQVCDKLYETNSLLIDKRMKDSLDRYTITGYGLCPTHEQLFNDGLVALVAIDKNKSVLNETDSVCTINYTNAYRTGELLYINRKLLNTILKGHQIDEEVPLVYVEPEFINKLKELIQED